MISRLSDRIAGTIVLVLAIWYWWVASQFPASFGDPVGAATFPQMVAVPTGLFALYLIVRPDPDPVWVRVPAIWKQIITVAILLAYPPVIIPLGYPLATFFGATALSRVLGGTWLAAVGTGLVTGGGLFIIFDRLLGLPLPLLPGL